MGDVLPKVFLSGAAYLANPIEPVEESPSYVDGVEDTMQAYFSITEEQKQPLKANKRPIRESLLS